tara:strand:+ start:3233 stop:3499 length:267 start_codon:yes stop_codon:yes gene_type:complete
MGKIGSSSHKGYASWWQNVSQDGDQPIHMELTRMTGALWKGKCKIELKVGSIQFLSLYLDLDELADIEMMLEQAREYAFPESEDDANA